MRSTTAADYQFIPRPVAAMAKDFPSGHLVVRHSHPRAQLLYAVEGLLSATTATGAWATPKGHALLIPPHVEHEVVMHGQVAVRTAYLTREAACVPEDGRCRVLKVSGLLHAALVALCEEPPIYDEAGRGGHLAALVIDEIARAPDAALALPLPQEPRLKALCRGLIEHPSGVADIEVFADRAGMSRRTCTRHFRDETGMSFGAWLRRMRAHAALAVAARGEPMRKAATAVGYRDPRALQSMMRRTMGPG